MTDILFVTVPKLNVEGPILAVAQLNGAVKKAGFTSNFLDFNAWLHNKTIDTDYSYIWNVSDNTLIDKNKIKKIEEHYTKLIEDYYWEKIKPLSPKIIGITVFSWWSWPNVILFSKIIKKFNPDIKILLGGPALASKTVDRAGELLDELKEGKIIDDYISGDAELSIVEYMKGNKDYPGINNFNYDNNFDRNTLAYPDYGDLDLSLYKDNLVLYISGSRGCVRKCAFCNVPLIWNKFLFKSGIRTAEELISLQAKYNISKFRFTDSLINGNQKEFVRMLEILGDYNKITNNPVKINGQFILRETHQVSDDMFDKMKQAGLHHVTVGIESGSEKVRFELGKPFSNKAIEYHLEHMKRVKIKMVPLMFVGFPTETDEDFQESIKILDVFAKYPTVVEKVHTDHPMLMIPGTPAYIEMEKYGVHDVKDYFRWTSKNNDYKKRIERHFIFIDEAVKRGLYEKPTISSKSVTIADDYFNEYKDHDVKVVKIIENFRNY